MAKKTAEEKPCFPMRKIMEANDKAKKLKEAEECKSGKITTF